MVTEPGCRVSISLSDDSKIEGVFLAHLEEFGTDFMVIDVGFKNPIKVSTGFIVAFTELPNGKVLDHPKKATRLRVMK